VTSITDCPTTIPATEDMLVIVLAPEAIFPVAETVAVFIAQFPAARNTVSPVAAAFIAARIQVSFHGLPLLPSPPPFAAQYVAAPSMRLLTVTVNAWPLADTPASDAATQMLLLPEVNVPLVASVSPLIIWKEPLPAPFVELHRPPESVPVVERCRLVPV